MDVSLDIAKHRGRIDVGNQVVVTWTSNTSTVKINLSGQTVGLNDSMVVYADTDTTYTIIGWEAEQMRFYFVPCERR
jgi:hypothetical protein